MAFFVDLIHHTTRIRPVEAYPGSPPLDLLSLGKGWQCMCHSVQQAFLLSTVPLMLFQAFFCLKLFPVLKHIFHSGYFPVAKDMRMTPDNLVIYALDYLAKVEFPIFIGYLSMQCELQQKISELLTHFHWVIRIQCFEGFVGLFQ